MLKFLAYLLLCISPVAASETGVSLIGGDPTTRKLLNAQGMPSPLEQEDMLWFILSFTDRRTIETDRTVCKFWDRVVQGALPENLHLTPQNNKVFLPRFNLLPVTCLAKSKIFDPLEGDAAHGLRNFMCILEACVQHTHEVDSFFDDLSRAGLWQLTWPLQSPGFLFQNVPELRGIHKQVLTHLLNLTDILTLDEAYKDIFASISENDAHKFYDFCAANERKITLLQIINRLNTAQFARINGCILKGQSWSDAQREECYCPIENPESMYQYVIDVGDSGVFQVKIQHQIIDTDEFKEHKRIPVRWMHEVHAKMLFEGAPQDFFKLNPLVPFMSSKSLYRLVDTSTLKILSPLLDQEGLATLSNIRAEYRLRTGFDD